VWIEDSGVRATRARNDEKEISSPNAAASPVRAFSGGAMTLQTIWRWAGLPKSCRQTRARVNELRRHLVILRILRVAHAA